MLYFVYILYSQKLDRYYIGTTDNVEKRLLEHNSKHYPDSFTVKGIPWELYLIIECRSSEIAYKAEKFIKKMKSKSFIIRLKHNPGIVKGILEKITAI